MTTPGYFPIPSAPTWFIHLIDLTHPFNKLFIAFCFASLYAVCFTHTSSVNPYHTPKKAQLLSLLFRWGHWGWRCSGGFTDHPRLPTSTGVPQPRPCSFPTRTVQGKLSQFAWGCGISQDMRLLMPKWESPMQTGWPGHLTQVMCLRSHSC